MKYRSSTLSLALAGILAPLVLSGQPSSPARAPQVPVAKPAAAAALPESQTIPSLPDWIKLGGVVRGRWENPSGMNFTPGAGDSYYLSRARLSLRARPVSWLQILAETQDSREFGYRGVAHPSSMQNPLDLRQAHVRVGGEAGSPFIFVGGRQELTLGSGRLIASSDWGNNSRTYDGGRLTLARHGMKADLFGVSAAVADMTRCDRRKPGEALFGSFFAFSNLFPKASIEPYLFERRNLNVAGENGKPGTALMGTAGFRMIGTLPKRLDYSAEVAHQFGSYADDRINATAGIFIFGWTVRNSAHKPRVSAEFATASGDKSAKDGSRQTFDQVYASNHSNYGIADMVGWRNVRSLRTGLEYLLNKKLKLQSDFCDFRLATVQDGLYNDGGTRAVLNRAASSRHVGSEIDFQSSYQFNKRWTLAAGVGHLFPGQYLKQSSKGSGYTYPYVSWTAKL